MLLEVQAVHLAYLLFKYISDYVQYWQIINYVLSKLQYRFLFVFQIFAVKTSFSCVMIMAVVCCKSKAVIRLHTSRMQAQILLVLLLSIAELKTEPKLFLVETNSTGRIFSQENQQNNL